MYQVDAFASHVFEGNPAAVVPLENWLSDEVMQKIALENNLSETAFFIPTEAGFHIRWLTPEAEVDLCGHATLATSHVLFQHLNYREEEIVFQSRSGILKVRKSKGRIVLNFPVSELEEIELPDALSELFQFNPLKCVKGREDYLLVFEKEEDIHQLKPDFQKMNECTTRGIIATAKSNEYDFVSRFFAPAVGINEDPVTGSAHTMLIPYWAKELNKNVLTAKQVSRRGGILHCKNLGDRVEIGGTAITYLIGDIFI